MNYLETHKQDRAGAAEISDEAGAARLRVQLLWQATVLVTLLASGAIHALKF